VFPDFERQRRGSASIWISRQYADLSFLEKLRDADQLFADPRCEIIKDQRKIRIGHVSVEINGRPQVLFIKRYNQYSLRQRFVSPFVQSGALRSLRGAAILRAANIQTPTPVAVVENRDPLAITKSFFITEEIAGGKTVDSYWLEELAKITDQGAISRRRKFLVQLGLLFGNLHGKGIYHNDLKDANILAVAERQSASVKLFLLDLEGVKRYRNLSSDRKLKNLVQINRTFGRHLRRPEKLVFLMAYMNGTLPDKKNRRHLIQNIVRESNRIDNVKILTASRTVGATPIRM
jgi:tRNA A-37 threonylcarbamoyl transferase component Bud32